MCRPCPDAPALCVLLQGDPACKNERRGCLLPLTRLTVACIIAANTCLQPSPTTFLRWRPLPLVRVILTQLLGIRSAAVISRGFPAFVSISFVEARLNRIARWSVLADTGYVQISCSILHCCARKSNGLGTRRARCPCQLFGFNPVGAAALLCSVAAVRCWGDPRAATPPVQYADFPFTDISTNCMDCSAVSKPPFPVRVAHELCLVLCAVANTCGILSYSLVCW